MTADILWLDLETRSRCDLKKHGVYNYALDASTEILCMCYALNDGEVRTVKHNERPPEHFLDAVRAGAQLRAHNAAFERLVLNYGGVLALGVERFYCTAAQSRANCAPGALEDVGRFASTDMRKDHRGAHLIRKLCIPQEDGTFNEDPLLMAELIEYCAQDVRTMRAVSKSLRDLTAEELEDYHVNERINDRGVLLDKQLALAATKYSDTEAAEIQALVRDITSGAVTSVRSPKMRTWVYERLTPTAQRMMVTYKDGVRKISIDKAVRANLLALAEEYPDEVPAEVADVIQCADDIWASSVAKFSRAAGLADLEDNRVRGAFVFAGGAATGRASSYGLQLHNYPRKTADKPDEIRERVVRGDSLTPEYGPSVNAVLKKMLRPSLVAADGKRLVIADWSAIEARITPWASGRGDKKLDLFRTGADVYKTNAVAASGLTLEEIDDHWRQIGKVMELACGFAGGAGAFHAMGRAYGISMTDDEAWRMVNAWRRANPWAVRYWSELEEGYMRAMRNPGHEIGAGRVVYYYDGAHLWYALPSGRVLRYPYARLEAGEITYAKCSWKPSADATEWPRARLWKGLATENITQALGNDILRHSLRQLEPLGVVTHCHDDIVIETDKPVPVADEMERVMLAPPSWCSDLPLSIGKPVISGRYGKG